MNYIDNAGERLSRAETHELLQCQTANSRLILWRHNLKFALKLAHRHQGADLEDRIQAAQEGLLRAIRKAERRDRDGGLLAHIIPHEVSTAMRALRRQGGRPADPLPDSLAAPVLAPEDRLEFMARIDKLPDAAREAILLRLAGYDWDQIALVMDLDVRKVRRVVRDGIKRMRRRMARGSVR